MGGNATKFTLPHLWKEDEPDAHAPLKYDPQFGFDGKRRLRVQEASDEEMDSIGMPLKKRDHCAKYYIAVSSCMHYYAPFFWNCDGFKAEYHMCKYRERMHDMKEFEREKRLNRRERLLAEAEAKGS